MGWLVVSLVDREVCVWDGLSAWCGRVCVGPRCVTIELEQAVIQLNYNIRCLLCIDSVQSIEIEI